MEFIIFLFAAFLSGFLSGSVGFSSGVLPAAILSVFIPADTAVPLLAPIVLLGAVVALFSHWGDWQLKQILIVIPPLLLGTWMGTFFLASVPESLVTYVIAFFVFVIGSQELSRRFMPNSKEVVHLQKYISSLSDGLLLGFLSGITSVIAHAGGVVISAYLISTGLNKDRFKGTILLFLVLADTAKLLAFLQSGLLSMEMMNPIIYAIPVLFAGVFIGKLVYRQFTEYQFRVVLAVVLVGLGIFLAATQIIAG